MSVEPAPVVVTVVPDVRGIAKRFDYLVPAADLDRVAIGSEVRVELNGRRVGGWVTAVDVETPAGVKLRPLAKVRGVGPAAELIELAEWAAWRWAGPVSAFLRTASPRAVVARLPRPAPSPPPLHVAVPGDATLLEEASAGSDPVVVRIPPATDRYPFVAALAAAALRSGEGSARSVLVVCPSVESARRLAGRLSRSGLPVALLADDARGSVAAASWADAAAGGRIVVGARAAAWAPAPELALALVVDAHDEALQEERAPTWHARDVVVERARRAGARAILLSPCPTLVDVHDRRLLVPARRAERAGWPIVDLVDRRLEDPRTATSLLSPQLAQLLARGGRVACVLNRVGRARLLACRSCGELARCESCQAAVGQNDLGDLACRRCGTVRPAVCAACGSGALKIVRAAVGRLREELEALVGEPVAEVTALSAEPPQSRVVIGTEAVLHRVGRLDAVAFCDIDQELTAPRFGASEQAMALLARAARLVGGRDGGGRLLAQTRIPDHPVLQAALHADPTRVLAADEPLRRTLGLPPFRAVAAISGPAAPELVAALRADPRAAAVAFLGPLEGAWLVSSSSHQGLCDLLAAVERPGGRVRVEVDPARA